MSSTLFVVPIEHQLDWEEWRGAATFILPIKGVFGRALCGTDGTIGDPTEFGPDKALEILAQCKPQWPGDKKDLDKVRRWAVSGKTLFAVWRH